MAGGIRVMAAFPVLVESIYSTGIYPEISAFLRKFSGLLSFSIGDVLYASLILYGIWKLVSKLRSILKQPEEERRWLPSLQDGLKLISLFLTIYIVFNLLWGLNYNRLGIHVQMDFERASYSKEDVWQLNNLLLKEVNECKSAIVRKRKNYPSAERLKHLTDQVYAVAANRYSFLEYAHQSVKPSLFNVLGNYLGYSGYYNPFTGEAQVNTDIPQFLQPFVRCHEIAHQLGYAKENEANFAGYIAATSSGDSLFMYAAYFDLFLYANRVLYRTDSIAAKNFQSLLHPEVQQDLKELKAYYKKYESPLGQIFDWVYGKYLKANEQPMGLVTYSEVVADVIGWYKKCGKING